MDVFEGRKLYALTQSVTYQVLNDKKIYILRLFPRSWLVGPYAESDGQLSAAHYVQFCGLEMSWSCQTGYLFGSQHLWVADELPWGTTRWQPVSHPQHIRC